MVEFVKGIVDSGDFPVKTPRDSAAEQDVACHQENSCEEVKG